MQISPIIQTPSPSLAISRKFYLSLAFQWVEKEGRYFVGEGRQWIEVRMQRMARAGLQLYAEDWSEILEKVRAKTSVRQLEGNAYFTDGNGCMIYLMPVAAFPDIQPDEDHRSTLGAFAGLSLETTDLPGSVRFWQILGFHPSMGSETEGWISLENEAGFVVSLMVAGTCPHLFWNPSLTYFNGRENLSVIEKIRKSGVAIAEEITCFNTEGIVDNLVLRDPGGLGIFAFSDG